MTPKRLLQKTTFYHSGSTIGARCKRASLPAIFSSNSCGRKPATCPSEKARSKFRVRELRLRRACRCHYKVLSRKIEMWKLEDGGLDIDIHIYGSDYICCAMNLNATDNCAVLDVTRQKGCAAWELRSSNQSFVFSPHVSGTSTASVKLHADARVLPLNHVVA
jgi:hypothetical protein